jgi:hypothetical protein
MAPRSRISRFDPEWQEIQGDRPETGGNFLKNWENIGKESRKNSALFFL